MSDFRESLDVSGAENPGKDLVDALEATHTRANKRYLAHHMAMRGAQTTRNMYGEFDTIEAVTDSTDRAMDEEPTDVAVMQRVTDTKTNFVVGRSDTSRDWRLVFTP